MKFDVSKLLQKSGNRERYRETWEPENISIDDDLYSIENPLKVSFLFYNEEGIIEADGSYEGILKYYCNRCLKDLQEQLNGTIKARFYPPERDLSEDINDTDQDELYLGNYSSDETIDIGSVVMEDLVLNRPMQVLCQPDCKGLCPECGTNLNEENCGHEKESIDPRLSEFREMDLPESD